MTEAPATLRALSPDEERFFGWTEEGAAKTVIAALEAAGAGAARFVGGCVRDSLLGETPKDFDIATTLPPAAVIAALKRAGLGAAPTGLDHGTVTGVADGVGVEITTLRADVSTDGRRATVEFTEDWALDARRRDFRLNAIYLTADKRLYDPAGGVADAKAGRVRFIGKAQDRIREDYLRILRFFRFSARFSAAFDAEGLAACAELKGGIAQLSAERVGDEFSKILALPRASLSVETMARTSIVSEVWRARPRLGVFAAMKALDPKAAAPLGLAALWGADGAGIDAALRLSNADAARRKRAVAGARLIKPDLGEKEARAVLYRLGPDQWRDALLLARAEHNAGDWAKLQGLADRWTPPRFPFTGKHAIAAGVKEGPAVAKTLKAVEDAWIAEDFPPQGRLEELLRENASTA